MGNSLVRLPSAIKMSRPTNPPPLEVNDDEYARYGRIAIKEPCQFKSIEDGRIVWDNDSYKFLEEEEAGENANASLWAHSRLCYQQGLFYVKDHVDTNKPDQAIYQIRGFDIDNVTFVESDNGVIVIDPTTAYESAKAAMEFYRLQRGEKAVKGMIYTHSHGDHFGGARAILEYVSKDESIPIIAPEGFMTHAVSETVYAGNAMTRRYVYHYGQSLERSSLGQIGVGLGLNTCTGWTDLIRPTVTVTKETEAEPMIVDGVRILFQLTPNTEAPAEMNFYFPDFKALCMAENATHTMHNIQTLRGALVRDARVWAYYLDDAIARFMKPGEEAEVAFASHHWPTWYKDNVRDYLSKQRDIYAYLHDQTLRMLNEGLTGLEIAENFQLPEVLKTTRHVGGFYGSVSHNVKAIYDR